ncbi:MAG: hypothetical protein Q4A19_01780 [Johnsonella sp.]|nr:hypothetical protein [Johnsonella sp.]
MRKKKGEKRRHRMRASFTIEISYIMAITMFCIANLILMAYRENARVLAGFVNHTAVEEASHIEEKYKKDEFAVGTIEAYALQGLRRVSALEGGSFEIGRDKKRAWSRFSAGELDSDIEYRISNPERFMRIITVLEAIYEKNKDGIQEEPEE